MGTKNVELIKAYICEEFTKKHAKKWHQKNSEIRPIDPHLKSQTRENFYQLTRPLFLKYSQEIEKLNRDDLMLLIAFAYSWMPTIPKVSYSLNIDERLNKAVLFINKIKSWDIDIKKLDSYLEEFENLKTFTNNSYVGMSKVLHFINPKLFCIYDSRVLKKIAKMTGEKKVSFINLNKVLYQISEETGYSMEQIDLLLWQ